MSLNKEDENEALWVTRPRPGHADLAGALKYNQKDVRTILERSSARETAARVAVGAVCKAFLQAVTVSFYSYTKSIGGIEADYSGDEKFLKQDNTIKEEALSALVTLGFNKSAVDKMLDKLLAVKPGITVEELIKQTLKNI